VEFKSIMQKKFRFYVFGYRHEDFWDNYGPVVRDLMICDELSRCEIVDSIFFFSRPKNILEVLTGKKKLFSRGPDIEKIKFINSISFDVFGVLKKRVWNEYIYCSHYNEFEMDEGFINVVVDFLPIGYLPQWTQEANLIWYDYIDNFSKHNRYSQAEINSVKNKYKYLIDRNNYLFTGVANGLLAENDQVYVVPNAVLNPKEFLNVKKNVERYDFGFMGFITDKFDINLVSRLSQEGYSVAIYGECYNSSVEQQLKNISNVLFVWV
jgi:hypothetical protein